MSCEEIREVIDAHALGALDWDEAERVEAHVAQCQRCAQALEEARATAAMLPLAVPLRQPPAALRTLVVAQALASPAGAASGRAATAPSARDAAGTGQPLTMKRWPGAWLAMAAAVAALAVGLGGIAMSAVLLRRVDDLEQRNVALVHDLGDVRASALRAAIASQLTNDLGQYQAALAVLAAPDASRIHMDPSDAAASALAYYYWSRSSRLGVLLVSNLPPPPPGYVYRMWVARGGRTDDVGPLDVYPNKTALAIVPLSGEPFAGMTVTMEPDKQAAPRSATLLLSTAGNSSEPLR